MNFVVFAKNLHRKTKKESHIQTVHFTSPALVDKTCIWVEQYHHDLKYYPGIHNVYYKDE